MCLRPASGKIDHLAGGEWRFPGGKEGNQSANLLLFTESSERHELRNGLAAGRVVDEAGAWIVKLAIEIVRAMISSWISSGL
jgi:hypothetical protein